MRAPAGVSSGVPLSMADGLPYSVLDQYYIVLFGVIIEGRNVAILTKLKLQ